MDPRNLSHTEDAIHTGFADQETDVIGYRSLTSSEAKKLRELLRQELVDDDNVPFCGHRPASAERMIRNDKNFSTVTLCRLCGTWARHGKLRSLGGVHSLDHLESLLPLPDFLQKFQREPDLPTWGRKPFYEVSAENRSK